MSKWMTLSDPLISAISTLPSTVDARPVRGDEA